MNVGVFYHCATCLSFPLITFSSNFAKFKRSEDWDHRYFLPDIVVLPTKSPIFPRFQGRWRSPGIAGEGSHLGAVAAVNAFASAKSASSEVRKGSWGPDYRLELLEPTMICPGDYNTSHPLYTIHILHLSPYMLHLH